MNFSEYLIEKDIVDESSLLEAFIDMQKTSIPVVEAIHKTGKLDDKELVKLINESKNKGQGLWSLLVSGGKLNNDDLNEVLQITQNSTPSLLETLVKLGKMDPKTAEKHFLDYFNENKESIKDESILNFKIPENNEESLVRPLGDSVEETSSVGEVEVSAAALESLKELGVSDESMLKELEEKSKPVGNKSEEVEISAAALESLKELGLDDKEQLSELESKVAESGSPTIVEINTDIDVSELESALTELVPEFDDHLLNQYLDTFTPNLYSDLSGKIVTRNFTYDESGNDLLVYAYTQFHLILGAAKMANLPLSSKLLENWEVLFEEIIEKKRNDIDPQSFIKAMEECLSLIWELRVEISSKANENGKIKDTTWKQRYIQNIKTCLDLAS